MHKFALYLKQAFYLTSKEVPIDIQQWASAKLGKKLSQYEVIQKPTVTIGNPWHERSVEYYQAFKLTNNKAQRTGKEVIIYGNIVYSNQKLTVPSGHVLVMANTYPLQAIIYTAGDAQALMPQSQTDINSFKDEELTILQYAKGLKPAYRPKFPSQFYDSLITKNLLKKNRSITTEGRNIIEDDKVKQRLRTIRDKYENDFDSPFRELRMTRLT